MGRGRRRSACTSSTSTARAPARPSILRTSSGSPPRLRLPVQLGGGLRSPEAIAAAFATGATRVVLGTAAFADEALLAAAVADHGERIVVSVDVRGGVVATAGWTQTGSLDAVAAARELSARGVRSFVYTDVDRDGMLGGTRPGGDRARN